MSEPVTESMAEVRSHLADVLDRARRDATPTIVTRRGKAEAVLIDIDEYRRFKDLEERVEEEWLSRLVDTAQAADDGASVSLEEMTAEILRGDR
ncbi:type II toxin-antitoxin system Phd/YefM family antitoxin [Nocardiopsis valliformis]|uniref:type II toxin-antitoxin system Phd/YefM family antitoxin n=1 Tax=Nocardiopsis valliformis TaxID=239974 RepID=UPI001EF9D9BD|nr:type II toxin-antitoxin system Phd/YefM family antitoxin [Nocardiopsis valliformis]